MRLIWVKYADTPVCFKDVPDASQYSRTYPTKHFCSQLLFSISYSLCWYYSLLYHVVRLLLFLHVVFPPRVAKQSLAFFVSLDSRLSVKAQTVSRFNLIFQDSSHFSDIYLFAKLTILAPDSFLLKELLSKTFSNKAAAYFFAVMQISGFLQEHFSAKVVLYYRTEQFNNFILTSFLLKHAKLNSQHFDWFIYITIIALNSRALSEITWVW